ncbi:sensor histidine kinase [Nocardia farcinica]|uniref:sensor histidine kinase n=1 Tax=Nocardia farcinica TaxID=37329 RepID=UPI0024571116|nr:histidine kinase [Nocardia farcinica]
MTPPGIANRDSIVRDCAIALIVAMIQVAGGRAANVGQTGVRSLDVLGCVLLLAGPIALVFRQVEPLPVLVLALTACGIYLALDYGYGPVFLAPAVAFLTAAVSGSRWWTYPFVPASFVIFVWPVPALLGRGPGVAVVCAAAGWLVVLVAAAEAVRVRRAMARLREERFDAARRAEAAQRERFACEERLTAARELHDVLAHSLSLINVQSSVALELFERKPMQARSALAAIKKASKDSLDEVHALLPTIRRGPFAGPLADDKTADPDRPRRPGKRGGVSGRLGLPVDRTRHDREPRRDPRRTPAEPAPAPRAPEPGLADLDALVQRARATGLTVQIKVVGDPVELPEAIDAAAAGIVQESLTNVIRHAVGATATVTVRYTAESVDITVDNGRPAGPQTRSPGAGNGIIGMRERAHALGGALTAGPRPSGGYRVAARLPVRVAPTPPTAAGNGGGAPDPSGADRPVERVASSPEPEAPGGNGHPSETDDSPLPAEARAPES